MKTHESEEMYLETILLLKNRRECVHAVDIVEELGYAKSSVSRAVGLLQRKGYIRVDGSGDIALTEEGMKKAGGVYERHCVITKFLMSVGADKDLAEANACRIEHVMSEDMFLLVKKFTEKTDSL